MERFREALLQGAFIVILGVICGLGVNAVRHDGLPVLGPGKKELKTVSVFEAWSLYQQGRAVFVDAREPEVYQSARLPGALSVPPESAKVREAELKKPAGSGKMLITYCDGPDCNKALDLAKALAASGLPGVAVMPDGWQGWTEAGFPIDEGEQ